MSRGQSDGTFSDEATLKFSFLAPLYKCTGRVNALPLALMLAVAEVLAKSRFTLKFYVIG